MQHMPGRGADGAGPTWKTEAADGSLCICGHGASGSGEKLTSSPGQARGVIASVQVSVKQREVGPPAIQLKVVELSIQGAELDLLLFHLFCLIWVRQEDSLFYWLNVN